MSTRYCPVCRERKVESSHHIKPRAEGGSDNHKNKAPMCKGCHDIVELIHNDTGIEYSPYLARLIRLEFRLTGTPNAQRIISEKVCRKLRFRFPKEKQERLKIEYLTPTKTTPEPLVLAPWSLKTKLNLASSGKRLYIATNGRAYTMAQKSNALREYPGIYLKSTVLSRVLSELADKVIVS